MTVGEQIADELYGLHCDIGRLEAENAMLRKLCVGMWLDLQKQLTPPWLGEYEQRMRELGVEVDG